MSWNPFKKKAVNPADTEIGQIYLGWKAEKDAYAAQEAARAKAEWDALPDHRKAARLEYRALQGLVAGRIVPEPSLYELLGNIYFGQPGDPLRSRLWNSESQTWN